MMLSIVGLSVLGFDLDISPVALEAYQQSVVEMSPLVLMGIVTIPGFLSLLIPSLVKHRNAQDTLKKLLMQIIHDKLASPATENPKDLLDMILPHATTDEAVSHTLTFMVAGHDTSSSSLGFIFGTLASHPEAISAIRAEYKRVVSKYGSLTTWEAIAELEYTHAVIQETLRLNAVTGIILTCLANVVMAEDDEGRTIRVLCFILLGIFVVVSAAACFVQWSSCLPQNDRSKAILSPQKGHEDESELRIAIASPSNEQA
ncbi:unnamed protein product [Aphanomyces euteiches]